MGDAEQGMGNMQIFVSHIWAGGYTWQLIRILAWVSLRDHLAALDKLFLISDTKWGFSQMGRIMAPCS